MDADALAFTHGMTPVTRFDEVREVLASSRFLQASKQESEPFVGDTLLTLDGVPHRRRRRLLVDLVRVDALRAYETAVLAPTIDAVLGELGEGAERPVRADLVRVARTLFLRLAAATIGLDDVTSAARTDRLLTLLLPLLEGVTVEWSTRPHAEVMGEGLAAKATLDAEFVRPALARRVGAPPEDGPADLLTLMLGAGLDPERDHETLLREVVLFLAASTLNNASLVTHVVEELEGWLRDHPADRARLDDGTLLPGVVRETLRLHVPSPALVRRASEEVVLASGRVVAEGEQLALDLAAANRDPDVYAPDPDRFDPWRATPDGIAQFGVVFGAGVHRCLGQPLVLGTYVAQDGGTEGMIHRILRRLVDAGVRSDPDHPPVAAPTAQKRYASYPVVLDRL